MFSVTHTAFNWREGQEKLDDMNGNQSKWDEDEEQVDDHDFDDPEEERKDEPVHVLGFHDSIRSEFKSLASEIRIIRAKLNGANATQICSSSYAFKNQPAEEEKVGTEEVAYNCITS